MAGKPYRIDPKAQDVYNQLIQLGVKPEEIDVGEFQHDYSRTGHPAPTLVPKTKGDHFISEPEVGLAALKLYDQNPQKFHAVVQSFLGRSIPWALDDLNPSTPLDAQINRKIDQALSEIHRELNSIQSSSPIDRQERLAAALFIFTVYPARGGVLTYRAPDLTPLLDKIGLNQFKGWLKANYGLGISEVADPDPSRELTALEALEIKKGQCTELSKILYGVFRRAGLSPQFVILAQKEALQMPGNIQGVDHLLVGLPFGNRMRLFDPTFSNPDASYKNYFPLTLLQFIAMDTGNTFRSSRTKSLGADRVKKELARAVQWDPQWPNTRYNQALLFEKEGNFDFARGEYKKIIEKTPGHLRAYEAVARIEIKQHRPAEAQSSLDFIIRQLEPKMTEVLKLVTGRLARVMIENGQIDQALLFLDRAIQKQPGEGLFHFFKAEGFSKKGDLSQAIQSCREAQRLNPSDSGITSFLKELQGRQQASRNATGSKL